MVNVTIYSSTMDPMGIDFLIVTCWFPTWLCWALHAVAASCSHSKAGRSRCLQVQGPAFPAHGMSQATSLHCVLPLSPSSVSSQPLLHEKTAERIPAVNNSSLVYPLSIRQNPINLCSIESFTFWIIYIYTHISFSDFPRQYLSRTGIQNENGVWLKQVDILWSFLPSIQAFYEFVSVSVSVLGGSPAFPKPECLHLKKFHWIWSIIYQSSEVIRSGPQSHCCHCSFLSIAGGGGGNGGPGERGEISPRGLGLLWALAQR